ncbi:hypothetical protein HBI56_047130 [Parastagonospora nodorum]|uniref:Uncharacterized protein n=1 Tax=Phaeosphaeria nodorum (strain SN15 / ATCC MYA-4574 / FGSC 10173) TaxID=321614 RepID=A0A7U2ERV2_PHANO|nr:hypothetical protein HBH56_060040 [Parastagonospora nodorum]QRC91854.1 hypothetical protein JI435_427500 [Parastagonospora nodorum SN15]KAH3931138.1 hypothetical protein HBH54_103970 [Parastagonospora nodorum]KAH3954442.1 hypothetical protein HBH53_018650 [Parastagonospora nodorum]KAH3965334.1 hypothetical protein HBH51_152720 [Parastagonospora nodorum]
MASFGMIFATLALVCFVPHCSNVAETATMKPPYLSCHTDFDGRGEVCNSGQVMAHGHCCCPGQLTTYDSTQLGNW